MPRRKTKKSSFQKFQKRKFKNGQKISHYNDPHLKFKNHEKDRIMCATMYKRYKKTLLQNEFTSIVPRDVIQGLEDTKRRFLMEALDILRNV